MISLYIDLDGVLCNFVKGCFDLFEEEFIPERWPDGEWEIGKVLGISKNHFWRIIDGGGHDFWANLEPLPWFDELVQLSNSIDPNFHLLTSPSRNPNCSKGKMIWIQKHFGWDFRRFILASAKSKHHCSGPNRILIDDKPSNIEDWIAAGGTGILFPTVWNTPFDQIPHDSKIVEHISEKIRGINLT